MGLNVCGADILSMCHHGWQNEKEQTVFMYRR